MTQVASNSALPSLDGLRASFRGELIGTDHPAYEQTRRSLLFNGMHDRRPALIARCSYAGDVQAALSYARAQNLLVAVRGGGHSTPGYSSCDDGVVIDTSPIKTVDIDTAQREGRFGAGLTWAELDAATQAHGLAVTGGRVSHTGIAGFTLGSGSGWLERNYGMTAASLLAAQVVTADGQLVNASADENPDLLWGLKGGAGNFGVVTEFRFRLHPVGPLVFAGLILHPRESASAFIRFYREFMRDAPDDVGGAVGLMTAPPAEFIPEAARGQQVCGVLVFYTGDLQQGPTAFGPVLEWGKPLMSQVGPMPYTAVQSLLDGSFPWGIKDYGKVDYVRDLSDQAVDTMVQLAWQARSPFSVVLLCPLGGAVSRMDRGSMALNIPNTDWMYFCEATSWDDQQQAADIAWAKNFLATMRPWSVDQAPPNFLEPDEGTRRIRASFGEKKFQRLTALKDRYDPTNVFSRNVNIRPSGARART
ncbi:MAG: FAD-binding oxidoreductase [Chloroflexi bacterium]|nr:FAD-binding oxidoreductase [Chloroflexota bacterium]